MAGIQSHEHLKANCVSPGYSLLMERFLMGVISPSSLILRSQLISFLLIKRVNLVESRIDLAIGCTNELTPNIVMATR
ncbi:hypothetical protein O9929_17620 [Vibrio lentus]|nr:hypothetical protein [Vibrio lentus]